MLSVEEISIKMRLITSRLYIGRFTLGSGYTADAALVDSSQLRCLLGSDFLVGSRHRPPIFLDHHLPASTRVIRPFSLRRGPQDHDPITNESERRGCEQRGP